MVHTEYLEILLGKKETSKEVLKTRDLFADFLRFVESEKLPDYEDEQLIEGCRQEIKDIIEVAKKNKVKIGKKWLNEDYINNLAMSLAQERIKEKLWSTYNFATALCECEINKNPHFSKLEGSEREEIVRVLRNMIFWLLERVRYMYSPTYRREVENLLQKYRME